MNKASHTFTAFYKKSPLFRTVIFLFGTALIIAGAFFVSKQMRQKPAVYAIDPEIGSPEDILRIVGSHFGNMRADSYVEAGGDRITASSYVSWTDNVILVHLPPNLQHGLIYVVTKAGKSEPKIFANKQILPVPILPDPFSSKPIVYSIIEKSSAIGKTITIQGRNFGTIRGNSTVYFTWAGDASTHLTENISCSEADNDFEFWDDTEIRVRVPDGAASGNTYVATDKGNSNSVYLDLSSTVGTKKFTDKRIYIVNTSVDISNVETRGDTSILLRLPLPPVTARQRSVEQVSSKRQPLIQDLNGTIVHQLDFTKTNRKPVSLSHSFAVTVYSVKTQIQQNSVRNYTEKTRSLYSAYIRSDFLIKPDDAEVKKIVAKIIGKETNPYIKAKLLYDYILTNFEILQHMRSEDFALNTLLEQKKGDSYELALLYCTLLRSAEIPSLPISGILIDKNQKTRVHWWCEFYIENFGWIPVDIALASGLSFDFVLPVQNVKDFYFGNTESQRVIFSRGWNALKQIGVNSKIVYRPKAYGLQSIWEESTANIEKYSSVWVDPYISGIY